MRKVLWSFVLMLFVIAADGQPQIGDCNKGILLCTKKSLLVKNFTGPGKILYENGATSCSNYFEESNSAWIKWTVGKSGKLSFVIKPLEEEDDLDFILYKLPGGVSSCAAKTEVRCMAAGKMLGAMPEDMRSLPCRGATGLWQGSGDLVESEGCNYSKDNFLEAVDVEKGESYALFVNNYDSYLGFTIEWGGDCEFALEPQELPELSNVGAWRADNNIIFLEQVVQASRWETKTSEKNRNQLFSNNVRNAAYDNSRLIKGSVYSGCKEINSKKMVVEDRSAAVILEEPTFGEIYPNPTFQLCSFAVTIPKWMDGNEMNLEIENLMGRTIKTIKQKLSAFSPNMVEIDLHDVPTGVYNVIAIVNGYKTVKKVVRINN